MIDLKLFRKVNKISRSELAAFFGVSEPFISQIENGRSKLPEQKADLLINNTRGWVVNEAVMATEPKTAASENWPAVVSELSARLDAQNTQIDRLLTIVERLTTEKK